MRAILKALLAVTPALSALAAPSLQEYAVAINVSGRERMLSQKMSKEYLLLALEVAPEANAASLGKTMQIFDASLQNLCAGSPNDFIPAPPNPAIAAKLDELKTAWKPLQTVFAKARDGQKPGKDDLTLVIRENLRLLEFADQATMLYQQASRETGHPDMGVKVNVAGRQRMLTQRMSKAVFQLALGIEPDKARAELKATRDLFEHSLKILGEGDASLDLKASKDGVFAQLLRNIQDQWKTFSQKVDAVLASPEAPSPETVKEIASLNPKLLAECQKLVSTFESTAY